MTSPCFAPSELRRALLHRGRRSERVRGVEPLSQPWEGYVMPLYHTRVILVIYLTDSLTISANLAILKTTLLRRRVSPDFEHADFCKQRRRSPPDFYN